MDGGNSARPVSEVVVSPWIRLVWKYARRSSMSRPIGIRYIIQDSEERFDDVLGGDEG